MSLTDNIDNMAGPSSYGSHVDQSPMEPSSSTLPAAEKRYEFVIPSNLLILPPAAATLGLVIGMTRGGRKARLRFLAENAHRQPRTYQGWYFYTKTRNYKIFLQASLSGGKYAIALGGGTAAYVLLEEYVAYMREELLGRVRRVPQPGTMEGFRKQVTWRQGGSVWWDGTVAGTVLGLATGLIWRLPRTLVFRCVGFGAVLGTIESTIKMALDDIGAKLQAKQLQDTPPPPAALSADPSITADLPALSEATTTDRPVQPSPHFEAAQYAYAQRDDAPIPSRPTAIDELFDESTPVSAPSKDGWWSSATSWVPGRS